MCYTMKRTYHLSSLYILHRILFRYFYLSKFSTSRCQHELLEYHHIDHQMATLISHVPLSHLYQAHTSFVIQSWSLPEYQDASQHRLEDQTSFLVLWQICYLAALDLVL